MMRGVFRENLLLITLAASPAGRAARALATATPFTLGEFGQLRNLSPIFDTYGLVPYTLTMDVKTNIPGGVYVYMQNGSYTKYYFCGPKYYMHNRIPAIYFCEH